MTIERNGMKIELTEDEIFKAYQKQKLLNYEEDIKYRAEVRNIKLKENDIPMLIADLEHCIDRSDGYFEEYWLSVDCVLDEY